MEGQTVARCGERQSGHQGLKIGPFEQLVFFCRIAVDRQEGRKFFTQNRGPQNRGQTTFSSRRAYLLQCSTRVGDIVYSPRSHLPKSAETAENPLRATVLAEPFPGTVTQGLVLVFAKEFRRL